MTDVSKTRGIQRLFDTVDNASLVFFRISFGVMMVVEVGYEYFTGNLKHVWADALLHFTYSGFSWLPVWSSSMMYVHFAVTGVCALMIALGLWYRYATVLFFLLYTYIFLIQQAAYQNHLYLFCLLGFILIFMPLNRSASLDVRLGKAPQDDRIGVWALWLVRFQLGLVYFFGGIAKLNVDWLQGEPMRIWLARRSDLWLVGPLMQNEWSVYFFSYGGLLFDLFIVVFLLWRKTRPAAFLAVFFFNLTNAYLFKIGPFPWVMLLSSLIFLEPDWPRIVWSRVARFIGRPKHKIGTNKVKAGVSICRERYSRPIVAGLAVYVVVQCLMPMRAFLYPGTPSWTDEGHFFSWRMMLRDKKVTDARMIVHDRKSGESRAVKFDEYLEPWQIIIMRSNPELLRQFAWYLADRAEKEEQKEIEVYARILVSLNGRPPALLIDPTIDLAAQKKTIAPADWILPHPEL